MVIKNDEETIACVSKVLDHLKDHKDDISYLNIDKMRYDIYSFSNEDKLKILKELLIVLCKMGEGSNLCKCFDKVTEETKKLGRELTYEEFVNIKRSIEIKDEEDE